MPYQAKLQSPFTFGAQGLRSAAAGNTIFARSKFTLNKAWFDGNPTFTFWLDGSNADTSDRHVYLYDATNSARVADLTVPAGAAAHTLISAVATITAAGDVEYTVEVEATTSDDQVSIVMWSLTVEQDLTATKTAVSIPLVFGAYNIYSRTDVASDYVASGTGTTYIQDAAVLADFGAFTKSAAAWDTVKASTGCMLDVVLAAYSGKNAYAALYQMSGSPAAVSGAEVTTNSTSPTHVTATFDWASMVDGQRFELQAKSNDAARMGYVLRASLVIFLSDLHKGEARFLVAKTRSGTSASSNYARVAYDPTKFSNPVCRFEITGSVSTGTATTSVYQTTDPTGVSGTEITSSPVTVNSATKLPYSSGTITPSSTYLYGHVDATAGGGGGTLAVAGGFLVVAWTGASSLPPSRRMMMKFG